MGFLLFLNIVLPVNKLQIGGLYVFLQEFCAFDSRFNLNIGLLFLHLLFEPSQFGFQNLIF